MDRKKFRKCYDVTINGTTFLFIQESNDQSELTLENAKIALKTELKKTSKITNIQEVKCK